MDKQVEISLKRGPLECKVVFPLNGTANLIIGGGSGRVNEYGDFPGYDPSAPIIGPKFLVELDSSRLGLTHDVFSPVSSQSGTYEVIVFVNDGSPRFAVHADCEGSWYDSDKRTLLGYLVSEDAVEAALPIRKYPLNGSPLELFVNLYQYPIPIVPEQLIGLGDVEEVDFPNVWDEHMILKRQVRVVAGNLVYQLPNRRYTPEECELLLNLAIKLGNSRAARSLCCYMKRL